MFCFVCANVGLIVPIYHAKNHYEHEYDKVGSDVQNLRMGPYVNEQCHQLHVVLCEAIKVRLKDLEDEITNSCAKILTVW